MPLLYRTLCEYLGIEAAEDDSKFRELSAAGKPLYQEKFFEMIRIFADASFSLNAKYLKDQADFKKSAAIAAWEDLFGFPPRLKHGDFLPCHADLACSGRKVLEHLVLGLAKEARIVSKLDNLILIAEPSMAHLLANEAESNSIWTQSLLNGYGSALGAALVGSKIIFQENLSRAHSLEEAIAKADLATSISGISGDSSPAQEVFEFYQKIPFNVYSNAIDAAKVLAKKNSIVAYKPLDKWLKKISKDATVLDAGCGAGF